MRGVIFRVLAGLLAAAFAVLLLFGDTTKMGWQEVWGIGAVAIGFGLYAVLGSDLGERFMVIATGGSDPVSRKPPG